MEHDPTFNPMGVGTSLFKTVVAVTQVLLAPVSGWMKDSGSSSSMNNELNRLSFFNLVGFAASNLVCIRSRSTNVFTCFLLVCRFDIFVVNFLLLLSISLSVLLLSPADPRHQLFRTLVFFLVFFPHRCEFLVFPPFLSS